MPSLAPSRFQGKSFYKHLNLATTIGIIRRILKTSESAGGLRNSDGTVYIYL